MKKIFYGSASIILTVVLWMLPGVAWAYSDVPPDDPHADAIEFVTKNGFMNGYADNTFRPGVKLNRAELMKVAFSGMTSTSAENFNCFNDVSADAWFSKYVCVAKENGYVQGYEDGTFRPGNFVTVAEAAKIISKSYRLEEVSGGSFWYSPFVRALAADNLLPETFLYINQGVTRAEAAEILWRLSLRSNSASGTRAATDETAGTQDIVVETQETSTLESLPSADVEKLETSTCQPSPENVPANIDMVRVRETWLTWNNDARAQVGLKAYVYNDQLGRTAAIWSEHSEVLGSMSHKRPGQTAYYDYFRMVSWFKDLGLTFKQVGSSGFTENIGWNYYSCAQDDCTDEVIDAIRSTFDYFMSEKGWSYRPHYDSIMSSSFQIIGIGLAIDEVHKKYYLTIHYGTEITSNPEPVCPV